MIRFNHTILPAKNAAQTALFTAEILGLPAPRRAWHFHVVDIDDEASIDYIEAEAEVHPHHLALLVDDASFDAILGRIKARGVTYFADPRGQIVNEINHLHGGRGFYFADPSGNYLECITAPYAKF